MLVGEAPLVRDEEAAGLEAAVHLRVHIGPIGGVAARLDAVAVVKCRRLKWKLVEVGLHEAAGAVEAGLGTEGVATVGLVLVERHAGDTAAGEAPNVAKGAANAATAIEDMV